MLAKGNYDPPDIVKTSPQTGTERRNRWLVPAVLVSGSLLLMAMWKKDFIQDFFSSEPL